MSREPIQLNVDIFCRVDAQDNRMLTDAVDKEVGTDKKLQDFDQYRQSVQHSRVALILKQVAHTTFGNDWHMHTPFGSPVLLTGSSAQSIGDDLPKKGDSSRNLPTFDTVFHGIKLRADLIFTPTCSDGVNPERIINDDYTGRVQQFFGS
ncbi:hypothetical protein OUZ56_027940 [Daphnia magna]|uniref:Uncharacterized protein n=1 Tax=Daphnia magna TaxID=35525 RepID=A0ABR0B2D1_9CRUS|nr:hypothetical protein OUZ56_027940 [Daphnia magna]